jgi:hypothetical protein
MRKKRSPVWSEVSDDTLRLIARIFGPDSAAQKAIDDLARRRDEGKDAVCYRYGPMLLVGPRVQR